MVGMSAGWQVSTPTVKSLLAAILHGFPFPVSFHIIAGSCGEMNSNQLVREAKSMQATHMMTIGADIEFFPWAIEQLMEHEKLIIGGPFNFRALPPTSTIVMFDEGEPLGKHPAPHELPREIFKCRALPGDFTLIDMKVFDMISPPYFVNEWSEDGKVFTTCDVYFCNKLRAAGIDIWCDPNAQVNHIGLYQY